ncbi:MAG: IPT/TIG domain-containing protein [Anaeromyxobacteraceae bacterium]
MAHRNNSMKSAAVLLAVLGLVSACSSSSSSPLTSAAPPSISRVSPPSGALGGGTRVTIVGANFAAGAEVSFGGAAGTVTSVVAGAVQVVTPAHAAGAVDVRVTNPDLQASTLPAGFTFEASPPPPGPAPVLTAVAPTFGTTAGGTAVTVSGSNLDPDATVLVGGVVATVTSSAAGSLAVTTPPHAAGAADVTVVNPDGQSASLAGAFTYHAPPPPAPTVTGVSPASGPTAGGTHVTVAGTGFVPGATVAFGGAAGAVTDVSATSITVTTPAHVAGASAVTVVNPDGGSATAPGAFTFDAPTSGNPPPVITSVSPAFGTVSGGTACVISGSGFVAGAGVGFGGVQASLSPGTVVTDSSISVTVPAHALGVVDVTVANPDGQVTTRPGGYTYLGSPPVVQALNVRGGPTAGGTAVIAAGSGFVAGVAVSVGGKPATGVSLLSLGLGRVAVAFSTPPQPEGRYDVVVTNPDGQASTIASGFHYGPAPVINTVTCAGGCDTVRPGDLITLDGANFTTGAGEGVGVLFVSTDTNQQGAPVFQSKTPTQLVVEAPKLDGGIPVRRYHVVVNNFDGQTVVAPSLVTYQ